jgi:uncharacterized repeat protein (TIGR01451 family)
VVWTFRRAIARGFFFLLLVVQLAPAAPAARAAPNEAVAQRDLAAQLGSGPPRPGSHTLTRLLLPAGFDQRMSTYRVADVNASGQVVGYGSRTAGGTVAIRWRDEVAIDLNAEIVAAPGWHLDTALGINDAGWIVGTGTQAGAPRSYLMRDGRVVALPVDLGPYRLVGDIATGVHPINAAGQVLGYVNGGPALFQADGADGGTISPLSGEASFAHQISDAGRAVGISAGSPAIWSASGALSRLPRVDGAVLVSADGISGSGDVVGSATRQGSDGSATVEGFLLRDGQVTLGVSAQPRSVNSLGQVVGVGPRLWQDGQSVPLETLLVPGSSILPSTVRATRIAEGGLVVGNTGTLGGGGYWFLIRPNAPTADLELGVAAAPNPAVLGQTFTYTFTVTNRGPDAARRVTFGFDGFLPGSIAINAISSTRGTCGVGAGRGATCTIDTLPSAPQDNVATMTITARVVGTQKFGGCVTATTSTRTDANPTIIDPNSANDSRCLTTPVVDPTSADLSLAVTGAPTTALLGEELRYAAVVTNERAQPVSGVKVRYTVPAAAELLSASPAAGCTPSLPPLPVDRTVTCTVGDVAVGTAATVEVVVRTLSVGVLQSTFTVSASVPDANPFNDTSTRATTVAAAAAAGTGLDELNASGARDPGEPGLADVPIFLDANGDGLPGAAEPTVRTAVDGTYLLTGMRFGSNRVCALAPAVLKQVGSPCRPATVVGGGEPGAVDFALSSDGTAPTTSIALAPAPTSAGWHRGDVAVALVASDDEGGTGVERLTYGATGAQPLVTTTTGGSASLTVSEAGLTTLAFAATDRVGNAEQGRTLAIGVDRTPPTVSATRAPSPNSRGWNNTDVTVSFACDDALSGVDSCPTAIALGAEGGDQSATGAAADRAGNTATASAAGVSIDKTAPTTSAALTGAAVTGGWHVGAVTLALEASDRLSGVASTSYSADGGATWSDYDAQRPARFVRDGRYRVLFRSVDHAGNVEAPGSVGFAIDQTPPAVACGVPDGAWHASDVSIACRAVDDGSGLASAADAGFALVTGVADGVETADAATSSRRVCDAAGNCATAGPVAGNRVDRRAPTPGACAVPDGRWHADNVALTCPYADGGSGPAEQRLTLTTAVPAGGGDRDARAATSARACDAVGNCARAPAAIAGNKVDRQAPSVVYTGNGGAYAVDQSVAIACAASDALSGVASSTCKDAVGPAYTFALGANVLSATATDQAGNQAGGSTTFTIQVTLGGLCALTDRFVEGSARFKALTVQQQAAVSRLVGPLCLLLDRAATARTPAARSAWIGAYQEGVAVLARHGWLTSDQAATLTALARAL